MASSSDSRSSKRAIGQFFAATGVILSLVFVGWEIRQNTSQLRADASYSITASVNEVNAGIYSDPTLAELILRGEADRSALSPVERSRFAMYQFSRINIAEFAQDLESEGVSDLNFEYVELIVREFQTKPGLQAFIREWEDLYLGSEELLVRLLGPGSQ